MSSQGGPPSGPGTIGTGGLQRVDARQGHSAPPLRKAPDGPSSDGNTCCSHAPLTARPPSMWWESEASLRFASPRQFLSDGYDPAFVVTVTGLGQLGHRSLGRIRR